MSDRVLRIIWDRQFGNRSLKMVLVRIAAESDRPGRPALLSVGAIACDLEICTKTVQRALREAEQRGLIRLADRELGPYPRRYIIDIETFLTFPLTPAGRRRRARRGGVA